MNRVRVKICGLTRVADVQAAVGAGADALGFNCYRGSPRHVALADLPALVADLPPFVTPVLVFVNPEPAEVTQALAHVPQALLQFHGDEAEPFCASFGRPYLRALRMAPEVGLLDCERTFASAAALLADAPAAGFGGGGQTFDWTRLPPPAARSKPLVLAGGLTDENVGAAILATLPYAVDVSSGVEAGMKGEKSHARIERFVAAVAAVSRSLNART